MKYIENSLCLFFYQRNKFIINTKNTKNMLCIYEKNVEIIHFLVGFFHLNSEFENLQKKTQHSFVCYFGGNCCNHRES